jgi:hypothetical protein
MKAIPITTCKSCTPDYWTVVGQSKFGAIYKCQTCKLLTDLLLKRN